MVFPYVLPTTSFADLAKFYSSNTHPSLPWTTTEKRTALREVLKAHKRLPAASQAANLSSVVTAINTYLPYLFAVDAGLSGRPISGEEVDIVLLRDVRFSWRCTLTGSSLPRDSPRTKLRSLDADIFFVLNALAFAKSLQARESLRPLYRTDAAPLEAEDRSKNITTAMRLLQEARSVHEFLAQKASSESTNLSENMIADVSRPTLSALASLALSEATLIAVLKDDPYPVAVADDRNKNSTDWMFKSPDLSLGRVNILTRICICAAQHAEDAYSKLRNISGLDSDLVTYVSDLKCTAKAKAARFQGIAAESQGRTGEAIGWLQAAQHELGILRKDGSKGGTFSTLKKEWKEKKEDKRIVKGDSDWGTDAGKLEESRVVDLLLKKWEKMNDTVSLSIKSNIAPNNLHR
jgi:hypothetical protein